LKVTPALNSAVAARAPLRPDDNLVISASRSRQVAAGDVCRSAPFLDRHPEWRRRRSCDPGVEGICGSARRRAPHCVLRRGFLGAERVDDNVGQSPFPFGTLSDF